MSVELEVVRENLAPRARRSPRRRAARAATGGAVELLAAIKYVAPEDMETLADAGIELVGENRVEQLLAKQEIARDRFTWDFIGHLQSRKARDLVGRVRLVHSLSTLSAAERLDRSSETPVACLVEVNVAGEDSKEGLAPDEPRRVPRGGRRAAAHPRRGADDDAAAGGTPRRRSRPYFAALRELAGGLGGRWAPRHGFGRLSMGTSQDYAVAVEEGATIVRLGSTLYRRSSV